MRGLARMRWVAVAAALGLIVSACGDDDEEAEEPEAPTGGSFSIDIGEPEFLIPGNTNESEGGQVLRTLYVGLYDYDENVNLVPAVADGLPETTDNITWTIKLKEGWTFHNGEPVTAQSFVQAWNTTAYGPNAFGNNYFMDRIEGYADLNPAPPEGEEEAPEPTTTEMSGLRAVDDLTIEIKLTAPFSSFPLLLGYTAFYPLADACVADLDACNETPIGNGPYQIVGSWEHNVQIATQRFEDYKGTPGAADEILFKIYDSQDAAYADFQAGELDIIDSVPPARVEEAKAQLGDRFLEVPTSNFTYVGFPIYNELFQDKRIRQAFSMAIDRQAIIDAVRPGNTPADSIITPVVKGYRPGACEYCVYDVDRAQQLLEEAGGWQGGALELWFNAGAGHDEWVQAVGDQLKQNLGIDYILKGDLQFADYLGVADAGVDDDPDTPGFTGPFRLGWIMDYPSPENYLKPLHGTQGSSNNTGYSNPQADDLIAQGDAAASLDEGITFYQQAEDLILEDMPVIPMFFALSSAAHNERVSNVEVTPFRLFKLEQVVVGDAA